MLYFSYPLEQSMAAQVSLLEIELRAHPNGERF